MELAGVHNVDHAVICAKGLDGVPYLFPYFWRVQALYVAGFDRARRNDVVDVRGLATRLMERCDDRVGILVAGSSVGPAVRVEGEEATRIMFDVDVQVNRFLAVGDRCYFFVLVGLTLHGISVPYSSVPLVVFACVDRVWAVANLEICPVPLAGPRFVGKLSFRPLF